MKSRVKSWCAVLSIAWLSACGGGDEKTGAETSSAPRLKQVPRNRTLFMDCVDPGTCAGQMKDYDSFNPYLPGKTSRTGYQFLYEPLYFYNAYKEKDNIHPLDRRGAPVQRGLHRGDGEDKTGGGVERRDALDGA